MQHLLVTLIFVLCVIVVVRRIVRIVSHAKKGESRCSTCAEASCPLRNASTSVKKRDCSCC